MLQTALPKMNTIQNIGSTFFLQGIIFKNTAPQCSNATLLAIGNIYMLKF